jgi:hypothetical protein
MVISVANYRIRPSSRTFEADWIGDRLADFGSCVTAIVPQGFEAYVRVFHPATGRNGEPISWSEIAAKSGRTMHRLAQFHAINRTEVTEVDPAGNGPGNGNLPPRLLEAVCAAVRAHTGTPDSCFFCLWVGYGWMDNTGSSGRVVFTPIGYTGPPPEPFGYTDIVPEFIRTAVASETRVLLPARDYLFFEGPLEGAVEFGEYLTPEHFLPQSPNLFWPEDRTWCVATEIDLFCTLIGGSEEMADRLIADPLLEAWRVFPDDPITWDSDDINQ